MARRRCPLANRASEGQGRQKQNKIKQDSIPQKASIFCSFLDLKKDCLPTPLDSAAACFEALFPTPPPCAVLFLAGAYEDQSFC